MGALIISGLIGVFLVGVALLGDDRSVDGAATAARYGGEGHPGDHGGEDLQRPDRDGSDALQELLLRGGVPSGLLRP